MMVEKKPHSNLFLLLAFLSAILTTTWLALTPSKSEHLVVLNYSSQRVLLLAISAILCIFIFISFCLRSQPFFQKIYSLVTHSTKLFVFLFFLEMTLLLLNTGILLGNFEPWNFLLQRIFPFFVFLFLIVLDTLIFQQIDGNKLPERVLTHWIFQPANKNEYLKPNGRDQRLDFLRGFFVFVMIVDHFGQESPLYYITFGARFFTSAAEGFFLISGIVAGIVYFRVLQKGGFKAAWKKSWMRALTIYLVTISLSLIVLLLAKYFDPGLAGNNLSGTAFQVLINLLLFQSEYYLSNILIVYCLLFIFFPLVLLLLRTGKTWLLIILVAGYYIASQVFPGIKWFPIDIFMEFPGVLLLFVSGVLLGYFRVLEKIPVKLNLWGLSIFGFLFLLLILLWKMAGFGIMHLNPQLPDEIIEFVITFFNKGLVAPGRLVASFITFGFLYLLLTFAWKRVQQLFGWLILPLGENTLTAYSVHVLLAITFVIVTQILELPRLSFWVSGIIQMSSVLIVWGIVKSHILSPTTLMRKIYYSVPFLLIGIYLFTVYVI